MKGDVVYVVTAWNERTNEDNVIVFSEKADADRAWAKLASDDKVYGGVSRRKVR